MSSIEYFASIALLIACSGVLVARACECTEALWRLGSVLGAIGFGAIATGVWLQVGLSADKGARWAIATGIVALVSGGALEVAQAISDWRKAKNNRESK